MGLIENWQFFHISFSAKKAHENVFDDLLEKKNAFLGFKNNMLIKPKNLDFFKGVSP